MMSDEGVRLLMQVALLALLIRHERTEAMIELAVLVVVVSYVYWVLRRPWNARPRGPMI